MTEGSAEVSVIKAYWQPGCTSCLRMKEFLTKHGVTFVSVNVLEDKDAFADLAALERDEFRFVHILSLPSSVSTVRV